ncbi:hypothetical protein LXA43DRAFT_101403 [Ganoderma leucocontextum]|nr:hypothetical protein LXA43DRAFT_101403 [Ganoderma leucocontextum]
MMVAQARMVASRQISFWITTTLACRRTGNIHTCRAFGLSPLRASPTCCICDIVDVPHGGSLASRPLGLLSLWIEYQARWKEMEHLQTEMWRFGFYPAVGQLSERLGWIHNHWWTSPVAWNFAMISLAPGSTEVSRHDMDVCITHIANTLETGGGILWIDRALPFGLAFLGLAPFGMWVRFLRVGSCYLSLPMNGIQRILFYLMAYLSVGSQYQHLRYPTTLHDKHSVANMLCTVHPRLEGAVEHVRRKFELGGEDGT